MAELVCLPLRAETKRWLKIIHYLGAFSLSAFAFCAFWVRVISENASGTTYHGLLAILCDLLWVTGISTSCWLVAIMIVSLLDHAQIINSNQQQKLGTISLSEDHLIVNNQTIAVSDLKSIVLISDRYAGAPRGSSTSSGAGKLLVVYKLNKQEATFLVVVQSARELNKLRELSALWRSRQITAFIMD
ncbi:hypothetical protein [uncultured Hymenobacter sp.]|uniref:hypothetical protein n=1 Tax=uncultured Hymenobacter sp. TaxID=170016 RepID=UPI0035CBCEF0